MTHGDLGRKVYIDRYRCSACNKIFPLDSKEIVPLSDGRMIHKPPFPYRCNAQVKIVKKAAGYTRMSKLKEILDMDIRDFFNMELTVDADGNLHLRGNYGKNLDTSSTVIQGDKIGNKGETT